MISKTIATAAVVAMLASAPLSAIADSHGAQKAAYDKMVAQAEASKKKAASVNGEWRDIGKFLKKADKLAKAGKYADATKLAKKARDQGDLGYKQALSQKNVGFPAYMK
jgi:Rieske Fe-S protein